jgi:hypothetical protein
MNQLLQILLQCQTPITQNIDNSMWTDLLINAIGAFIGILGALGLYFAQIRRQQRDKLKYVATLLESVIPFAKEQSEFCKTLSDSLQSEPSKFHLLKIQANSDLKRLADKLDQESFFHAYLAKYKRSENTYQSFRTIYSRVDFVDQVIDQLKDYLEKEYISITDKKKSYASYLEDSVEKVALMTVNPKFQQEKPLLDFLNKILVSYHTNRIDDEDLDYPMDSFIIPTRDFLATNYSTTPECNEIIVLLKRAINKHYSFILQAKTLGQELKEFEQHLKQQSELLSQDTKTIREDFQNSI